MNFMQKRIFCFIISLALVLSCFAPFRAFAATEEILAAFEYTAPSGTKSGDALAGGDGSGGYYATSGAATASAMLYASVNGTNFKALEWSKTYTYDDAARTALAPVMAADADNMWCASPYFEVKCSTKGYDGIKFSAKVSGSNKGPANYKLQYSTDRISYVDIAAAPTITDNKNMQSNLFDNISVSAADDKETVYFRITTSDTKTIEGKSLEDKLTGGEAAINDIIISGTSKSGMVTPPDAPAASIAGGEIYANTAVSLSCTSPDVQLRYTVNGGDVTDYTGKFMPFKNVAGDTAVVTAWATQNGTVSDKTVCTYTSTKDAITAFDFSDGKYPEYVNGAVNANSGIYPTGRIAASLDGVTRYAPLYSSADNAISISPDDGYLWQEGGYWQLEASTAGYKKIYLCADAFSSRKGPASMTLQYSTDGSSYETLCADKLLPVSENGAYYSEYPLPPAACDRQKIYLGSV